MATNKNSTKKPNSLKTKFAFRFLRAMKKLNKKAPPSSMTDKHKRCHAIRAAAYASMASVVGPNKAWSRAVLRKIKKCRERKRNHHHDHQARKKVVMRGNPKKRELGFGPENDLRELVPGGKALDFDTLLKESGHYMKCLRAQVEVMRKIVDYSSI